MPSVISYSDEAQTIDDAVVRRYFEGIGAVAAAASYMSHERDMPMATVRYRFRREGELIEPWLSALPRDARVLDVGCGAGAWAGYFADRFASVTAIDRSPAMLEAARRHLSGRANVTVAAADARTGLPAGPFDLAFLGGVCMYLDDGDAKQLLDAVRQRLAPGGVAILRESTVRTGVQRALGTYHAVYRSIAAYRDLFAEAGFPVEHVALRRNDAYDAMNIAGEIVLARRRKLRFLPEVSPFLGALTWWSLRATAPLSIRLVPALLDRAGVHWPRLSNHFFRLGI